MRGSSGYGPSMQGHEDRRADVLRDETDDGTAMVEKTEQMDNSTIVPIDLAFRWS